MRYEKSVDKLEDQKGACNCYERIRIVGIRNVKCEKSVDHPGDTAAGTPEACDVSEIAWDGKTGVVFQDDISQNNRTGDEKAFDLRGCHRIKILWQDALSRDRSLTGIVNRILHKCMAYDPETEDSKYEIKNG